MFKKKNLFRKYDIGENSSIDLFITYGFTENYICFYNNKLTFLTVMTHLARELRDPKNKSYHFNCYFFFISTNKNIIILSKLI